MKKEPIRTRDFQIETYGQNVSVEITPLTAEDYLQTYKLSVDFPEKTIPRKIRISWAEPFINVFGVWTPRNRFNRGMFLKFRNEGENTRFAYSAPVLCLVGKDNKNSCTFALSDVAIPAFIGHGFDDQSRDVFCNLEIFTALTQPISHYEAILRIDSRDITYDAAIRQTRQWWDSLGYKSAYTPEAAKHAMFSTWYNYQKRINAEDLLEICREAKEYGMNTIILDDGWQEERTLHCYDLCGDWIPHPSKFPDMGDFVDKIHQMGMKVLLWYALPMMGLEAENYPKFLGKYLFVNEKSNIAYLDPRFADVREHLIKLFVDAVKNWNLDGLKLDFIDAMTLKPESPTNYEDMDIPSLEVAIEKLLTDIITTLQKINPDIMIEFRQSYIGPGMQQCANILRVADCAGGALINRIGVIDLRLITDDSVAIHSDMLVCNYDAPVEQVAEQIVNILYSVPQISLDFTKMSDEQKKMLKFYLKFVEDNKYILIDGKLISLGVEAEYTQAYAQAGDEVIDTAYSNPVFAMKEALSRLVIVNASGLQNIYVDNTLQEAEYNYEIVNCMGEITEKGTVTLKNGATRFTVPRCGMVTLKK